MWKAPRDLTEVLLAAESLLAVLWKLVQYLFLHKAPPLGQDVLRYPVSKALSFVNLANDVAAYHSCCAIHLRRCCQVSEHCIVPELSSETKRTPNYVIGATKWAKRAEIFVVSRVWNVGHLETTEHNYSCEFLNRKRVLFFTKFSRFSKDYKFNTRWSLCLGTWLDVMKHKNLRHSKNSKMIMALTWVAF